MTSNEKVLFDGEAMRRRIAASGLSVTNLSRSIGYKRSTGLHVAVRRGSMKRYQLEALEKMLEREERLRSIVDGSYGGGELGGPLVRPRRKRIRTSQDGIEKMAK